MRSGWILAAILALAGPVGAASVVVPAQASEPERVAAVELADYLGRIFGSTVPVVAEGENTTAPVWYVGATRKAAEAGVRMEEFGSEEYLLKSLDAGDWLIAGGDPRGLIYGVWDYLERFGGVLWLTEECTVVPSRAALDWSPGFALRRAPAFAVRGIYAYFDTPHESRRAFMARNRLNFFHGETSLAGAEVFGVAPIFDVALPAHTYYSYTCEWPEGDDACFALLPDGTRPRATSGSGPGQICFTYPETRRRFARQLRERIERDRARFPEGRRPVIYDISQNDNNQRCECASCLARAEVYGDYSGVVLEFINELADTVAEYAPEVKLQTFAYMFSEAPPAHIRARPNVIVRLAQLGSEFQGGIRDSLRPLSHPNNAASLAQLERWSPIAALSMWDYWILYLSDVAPAATAGVIAENLRTYHNYGVQAIFAECENPYDNAFYALRIWIGARFADDPERNVDTEINRFMTHYYGAAAPMMRSYYDLTATAMNTIPARLNDVRLRQRCDLDAAYFRAAEEWLNRTEAAVGADAALLRRIGRERVVVDRAYLGRRLLLEDGAGLPSLDAVCSRLERNWLAWEHDPERQAEIRDWVAAQKVAVPLPPEFAARDVVYDLPWPRLTPHYRSHLEEDADAAGGRAIVLALGDSGLEYGVFSSGGEGELATVKIPLEQLPRDERYHWYSAGVVTLTPKCYFRVHSSWEIQRPLDEFYENNGISNTYEIFASVKVTGPAYVPGSADADSVRLDRILLVRP